MKKIILFLLFACSLSFLKAQQQYNCYHVQEFLWNSQTQAYDTPVQRNETCSFKIDAQKKQWSQTFQDETTLSFPVKSETFDQSKNIQSISVISPANGYQYVYKIDFNAHVIEVKLNQNNKEVLLKKYLFKD